MHSSADTAVESLMVADLERCFPDFRKQTKFKQCLNKRKKVLSKQKRCSKGENPTEIKIIQGVFMRKS